MVDSDDTEELRARVAVLEAENEQLREEYARARQVQYRRTALGLGILGVLGLFGAGLFPDARTVLVALGGTGIFAGFLTYVLTPEQFVSARIGGQVFRALQKDRTATIDELGLAGDPVYVPGDEVRLFIPRYNGEPLPKSDELNELFVVPADPRHGGVSFHPTGAELYTAFEDARSQPVAEHPESVASATADAIVELFELADGVDYGVDSESNRIIFELEGARFGDPAAIDHPITSFCGVTVASIFDAPVQTEVTEAEYTRITCRY